MSYGDDNQGDSSDEETYINDQNMIDNQLDYDNPYINTYNYKEPLITKPNFLKSKKKFNEQEFSNSIMSKNLTDETQRDIDDYNYPKGTQHYWIAAFYTNDMSEKSWWAKIKLYFTSCVVMKTTKDPFTHCVLIDMNNYAWNVEDGGQVTPIYKKKFSRDGFGNFRKINMAPESYISGHKFIRKQQGKPFNWKSFWYNHIPFVKNLYPPVYTNEKSWYCSELCVRGLQHSRIIPTNVVPHTSHPHSFYDLIKNKSTECDHITAINYKKN